MKSLDRSYMLLFSLFYPTNYCHISNYESPASLKELFKQDIRPAEIQPFELISHKAMLTFEKKIFAFKNFIFISYAPAQ